MMRQTRTLCLSACLPFLILGGCETGSLKPGATSVLQFVQPPSPAESVELATDKYDPDKRFRGTTQLANAAFANEEPYIRLFEFNANDADPGVRAASIRALGLHGSPSHVPLMVSALKDTDPGVRIEAARSLQRLHDPAAVDALLATLDADKETEAAVRVEAARALGQYAQNRVVERLIATLRDEKLAVNFATQESLRTLTGQDFGVDPGAWQSWYRGNKNLFDARRAYVYPVFSRGKRWYEYLPFVPPPPNEPSAMPAGLTVAEFADVPASDPDQPAPQAPPAQR